MNSYAYKTNALRFDQNRDPFIVTNLYKLVEAIGDEVQFGEEDLIPAVIAHLIKTGRLRTIEYEGCDEK